MRNRADHLCRPCLVEGWKSVLPDEVAGLEGLDRGIGWRRLGCTPERGGGGVKTLGEQQRGNQYSLIYQDDVLLWVTWGESALPEQAHDEKQHRRPGHGSDQGTNQAAGGDAQQSEQEPANESANDADDDVAEQSESPPRMRRPASQPASQPMTRNRIRPWVSTLVFSWMVSRRISLRPTLH